MKEEGNEYQVSVMHHGSNVKTVYHLDKTILHVLKYMLESV
ncbi:MAG: hypothetical protein ACRDCE_00300 [Cetobacterium sp.]